MPRPRRSDSVPPYPASVAPSELCLSLLAAALLVAVAWRGGSLHGDFQHGVLGFSVAGLLILALRARESGAVPWVPLLPALLWSGFVAIALANPSHDHLAQLGWVQRADWIRWLPATTDAPHTMAAIRLWLPALLVGGLASALLHTPAVVRTVWTVVAVNGCALAITGAFFHFAGSSRVLGIIEPPERSYFFATFFYKNHWAAFGALAAIASLTLALRAMRAALAGDPRARGRVLLFSATGLLTAVTLPLPGSRAGAALAAVVVAAFCGGFLAYLVHRDPARTGSGRRPWLVAGVLAAGIIAFGVHAYAPRAKADFARTEAQWERSQAFGAFDVRQLVSRDTWRMARDRLWFGWGPGCYEIGFPLYHGNYLRDAGGRVLVRFDMAHNDWLHLLAEGGLVGAGLLFGPALIAGWRVWRRAELAGRWALGGCALVAIYAWIDFPFHNPAVLLTWVVLLTTAHRLRSTPAQAGPA